MIACLLAALSVGMIDHLLFFTMIGGRDAHKLFLNGKFNPALSSQAKNLLFLLLFSLSALDSYILAH